MPLTRAARILRLLDRHQKAALAAPTDFVSGCSCGVYVSERGHTHHLAELVDAFIDDEIQART